MVPREGKRPTWDSGTSEVSLCPGGWKLMGSAPLPSFSSALSPLLSQVFLVRKITRPDSGHLYAMKVLKKATLKGEWRSPPHAEPRLGPRLWETAQLSRCWV